jgi:hypothetical protein
MLFLLVHFLDRLCKMLGYRSPALPCRCYATARHLCSRQRAPRLRPSAESGWASCVDASIQAPPDDTDCRPYAFMRCSYRMVHFFVGFFDDCWGRGLRTAL